MNIKKLIASIAIIAASVAVCAIGASAEKSNKAYINFNSANLQSTTFDCTNTPYVGESYYEVSWGVSINGNTGRKEEENETILSNSLFGGFYKSCVTEWDIDSGDFYTTGTNDYTVTISNIRQKTSIKFVDDYNGTTTVRDFDTPKTIKGYSAEENVFLPGSPCVVIDHFSDELGITASNKRNKTLIDIMQDAKDSGIVVSNVAIRQKKDGVETKINADDSKVLYGNLEGNGDFEIRLGGGWDWVNGCVIESALDGSLIDFNESLSVDFTISVIPMPKYEELSDGTVKITGFKGAPIDFEIPETINGKKVTVIDDFAFKGCTTLKSIKIPDSVVSIGNLAFYECTSLESIGWSNSLRNVGNLAFYGCKSFKDTVLPDSVISIGNQVFYGCNSMESITIPKSVDKMGDDIFGDIPTISIKCYSGSLALSYAKANSIDYELLDHETHSFGEWEITTPATCRSTGEKRRICSICGEVEFDIIEIAPHTEMIDKAVPATCTETGLTEGKHCAVCGLIFTEQKTVPAKGHTEVVDRAVPATCTETGLTEGKHCAVCGLIFTEQKTVPAKGHTEVVDRAVPATCTETGLTEGKHCAVCGLIFTEQETVPAKGHNYIAKEVNPTYTANGYTLYSCSVCGYSYKDNETAKLTLANVTGFKVKSLTSTNVTLQWNKNSAASGYEIEQYKGGKWVNVAKITSNATTSYTVKGLKAGTAGYQFRIRAYRTEGKNKAYSSYSATVKVNTNPYGVSGFKCSSKTSTSVTLKWNKGTTASGYQLQQYKDGKWVTIYTGTKATNTSYTVKKLKAGTAGYRFRIRAYKTYGNTKQYGSWSREVKVNTNPYGVGGFKAKSTAKNSITLGWNKGTTASGYQLQQYKGGKWVTVYTGTKATSTSYTIKNLKKNTSYKFRIRAYKTYGNTKQYGSWSKVLTVRTKR